MIRFPVRANPTSALIWVPIYLGISTAYGFSFLLMKVGLTAFAPLQLAFIRIVLGAMAVGVIFIIRGKRLTREKNLWWHAFISGALIVVIPITAYIFAQERVPSTVAGILSSSTPFFALAATVFFSRTLKPKGSQVIGLVISFLGVILILGVSSTSAHSDPAGVIMCLGGSFSFGLGAAYSRKFINLKLGLLDQTLMQLFCASLLLLPLQFLSFETPHDLNFRVVMAVLAAGIVALGFANVGLNSLYRYPGVTIASTINYLIPVVAASAGILLLNEKISVNELVGAAIIIVGLFITQRGKSVGTA